MDLAAISAMSGINGNDSINSISGTSLLSGMTGKDTKTADGTMFEAFFNTAVDNIKTTNSYLSDWENEEIKFALGETENTHDLTIALQKASTALQYTVAVRDKVLEAYKELMNMQI